MGGIPVVLIVEDEELVRYQIANEFRRVGWVVLEARTGEGAIALLEELDDQIEAIFTDIELGGRVSGWDVADAYRAAYPRVSVAYASGHDVDAGRTVCCSRFFGKPYVCEDVLDAFDSRLNSESDKGLPSG